MEAQRNLEKISVLRKFWEDNREILKSIYDVKIVDDKAAEIREKEKKYRDQQRDITYDWKVLKICVAGDFSSGKSTFINSLLGEELLGMDINPSTAKTTALTYGPELRFFKFIENNPERIEISKEEFDKFSVKNEDRKVKDDIDHFEVTLPNDLLKRINLYDTPGFNTAKYSNVDEDQTLKQVDKSDLVIWLSICCDGSIKSSELEKLQGLQVPFHCIVNQIDDMPEEEVAKVLDKFENQIRKINDHSRVFPYAARPILENSLRFSRSKETFEKILQSIVHNNNDLKLEIKSGMVCLNGREEIVLPRPVNNLFAECKRDFQKYLEDCILDKKEMRKYEQKRLDRTTKQYCSELMTNLSNANTLAIKRVKTTNDSISETRTTHELEIKDITKRINKRYQNLKTILLGDLKESKFYLYHYDKGASSAKDNDDYHVLRQYVEQSANKFAKSLIESFKEEYSLDAGLKDWGALFHNSIRKVIEPTIESIPRNITIKGMDYAELLRFEHQQVDNMIPDELFFSLLNLHCKNLSYQKLQCDLDHLNILVHALEEFTHSASCLLNKLKSNEPFNIESMADSTFRNDDVCKQPHQDTKHQLKAVGKVVAGIILKKIKEGASHAD